MNGLPDSEWKKFAKYDQDPFDAKLCFCYDKHSNIADYEAFKGNKIMYGMEINIEKLGVGKLFSLPASSLDTIKVLKKKIQEILNIPIRLQRLLFSGKILENKKSLSDYNVQNNSTLLFEKREDFSFVKVVEVRDGTSESQKIQEEIEMSVKMPSDITITVKVSASDTIRGIKNTIKNYKGIPSIKQMLVFESQELEDERSFGDYNIPQNALLQVSLNDLEPEKWFQEVSICFQEKTFVVDVQKNTLLRDFNKVMAEIVDCPVGEIMFLSGGRFLVNEERPLKDLRIDDYCSLTLIPRSNGGDGLRFIEMMGNTRIEDDLDSLKGSLSFLEADQDLQEYIPNALNVIQNLKKSNPDILKTAPENGVLAIMLWASNILNTQLNQSLAAGDYSQWNVYLKHLLNGIKAMPYFQGKTYAGFFNYQDRKIYKKGNFVNWTGVSTLTKNKQRAELVTNDKGTFFEVDVLSSKEISAVSIYGMEDVLMLPFSCFEVIDVIESPGNPMYVKLREVSVPREKSVIFWVDDKPRHNYELAKEVEKDEISCVFCVSTKDALREIDKYRWLLSFDDAKIRIVTDMVREENGSMNYTAGIDLVEKLVRDFQEKFEVLIFCGDEKRAQESCNARKLKGNFSITSSRKQLQRFLNFQPL